MHDVASVRADEFLRRQKLHQVHEPHISLELFLAVDDARLVDGLDIADRVDGNQDRMIIANHLDRSLLGVRRALQQALEHLLNLVRRGGLDQIMQRAHFVPRKRELHAHADEDELHLRIQRPRLARQVDAQPVPDIIVEKDQLVFFRLEGAQAYAVRTPVSWSISFFSSSTMAIRMVFIFFLFYSIIVS